MLWASVILEESVTLVHILKILIAGLPLRKKCLTPTLGNDKMRGLSEKAKERNMYIGCTLHRDTAALERHYE